VINWIDKITYYLLFVNVACSLFFLSLGGYDVIFAEGFGPISYENIKIGIVLLCLTPLLRVIFCLWEFLLVKDWLYVGISSFLISILISSFYFNGVLTEEFKFFIHSDFDEIEADHAKKERTK